MPIRSGCIHFKFAVIGNLNTTAFAEIVLGAHWSFTRLALKQLAKSVEHGFIEFFLFS